MAPAKNTDFSMALTIVVSAAIVAAAVVVVCLYRFTGFFTFKTTEKTIADNLDFNDSRWIENLIEITLPSYKKDFSIYSAFSAVNGKYYATQVYVTRARLDETRIYYREKLDNPRLPETNDVAVLEISGTINGRNISVINYFSEASNLIQVEMEMSGKNTGLIWRKIIDAFPLQALAEAPEIAAFAEGESTEGYVMYNNDEYATDVYANIPIFSRAYSYNGTMEELKNKINLLKDYYKDNAVFEECAAAIQHNTWLYQIKALEGFSGIKAALVIQKIPKN